MDTKSYIMRFRRNRKTRKRSNPLGTIALLTAGIFSLAAALIAIYYVDLYSSLTSGLPSPERLEVLMDSQQGSLLEPTRIMASGGEVELWRFENPAITSRRYISITDGNSLFFRDLTEDFVNATLAAFDPGYLDKPEGFILCMLDSSPDPITSSLVDDLLLWGEQDHPDFLSRLKLLSCQLTSQYGRYKLFEWYLNSVYFGQQIYGAAQASEFYFGKDLIDLDLAESALLTALIKYPALTPYDSPSAAKENQEEILRKMAQAMMITAGEEKSASAEQLFFSSHPDDQNYFRPAFVDLILAEITETIPEDRVLRGGYQIISTIDPELQSTLECSAKAVLNDLHGDDGKMEIDCEAARLIPKYQGSRPEDATPIEVDLVLYDPESGVIRGLTGLSDAGREPDPLKPRNPGSLITTYLYLNEFTRGFEPASLIWDVPLDETLGAENLHPYCGGDCTFSGPVSMRTALVNDYLSPAKQLWSSQVGNQLRSTLTVFGFSLDGGVCSDCSVFPDLPALDLVEVVQGFGVFNNLGHLRGLNLTEAGYEIHPRTIERIESWSGELIEPADQPIENTVIGEELAYLINHALSDAGARIDPEYMDIFQIGRPAAVKTGSVPEEAAAWVVGYTPQYVVGIWAGSPEGAEPNALDYQLLTANLWRGITQHISRDLPNQDWEKPENILELDVCYPSGMLPTEQCPRIVREIFIRGNEPQAADDLYQALEINRETGLLASVFTPAGRIEQKVFLNIPPLAEEWAVQTGQVVPPSLYDLDVPDSLTIGLELVRPENFSFIRGRVNVTGNIPEADFVSARLQYGVGMNPGSWLQLGEEITEPGIQRPLGSWDTRELEDGIYALQLVMIQERQGIQKSSLVVSVDNTPPEIKLLGLPAGGEISSQSGEEYLIEVSFENPSEISQVDFYLDGDLIYTREFPPFIYPWKLIAGEHELLVTAVDQAGNQSEITTSIDVVLE